MRTFTRASAMLFALMYGISVTGAATAVSALPLADKHEHKEGENHKHEEPKGERHELGSAEIGGFTVAVTQVGEAKPGEPALFIAKVSGGKGEPKAVRAWVGVESGKGSIKAKAEEESEGEWHAHFELSKPLPKDSKLWIEVESDGAKSRSSFAFKG